VLDGAFQKVIPKKEKCVERVGMHRGYGVP
jgi:hypothetical protein